MTEMSPAQIVAALEAIRAGKQDAVRASEVEEYLVNLLLTGGTAAVGELLSNLEGMAFTRVDAPEVAPNVVFRSGHDDNALIVEALAVEDIAAISIAPEDSDGPEMPAGHDWFYDLWAKLADAGVDQPGSLDEPDRTVYLIASFEADVMNGGFGQYLSNTDGAFVEDTTAALEQVGADKTATLLGNAAALKLEDETWDELWVRADAELDAITEMLMASDEYLALQTAKFFGKAGDE